MADEGKMVGCGVATPGVMDTELTIILGDSKIVMPPSQAYILAGSIMSACALLALNRRVMLEYGNG